MRDYLLLILLVMATAHAHAKSGKDKKLDLTPPGQKTEISQDPGSATPLLYADPKTMVNPSFDAGTRKGAVSLTATCTDNLGMLHKKGDAGYDGCLRSRDRTQPDVNKDPRRGPSLGITVGK